MNELRLKTHIFSEEIFQFSLITYLVLLLSESLKTGFVSNFINLNIPLFIVLITGVLMVLTQQDKFEVTAPIKRNLSADIQNSIVLAVIGGLLVFFKTQELGKISIVISILTMVLITFLSILLLTDSTTRPETEDITEDTTIHSKKALVPIAINKSLLIIPSHTVPSAATQPLMNHVIKSPFDRLRVEGLADRVIRSQMKALLALEKAQVISEKLERKFRHTENHTIFVEKLHPLNIMILESLQKLTEDLEEDLEVLPRSDLDQGPTLKRERLEKMVLLHTQTLHLRIMQLS